MKKRGKIKRDFDFSNNLKN